MIVFCDSKFTACTTVSKIKSPSHLTAVSLFSQHFGVTAPLPNVRRLDRCVRPTEPAWPPPPSSKARSSTSAPVSTRTSWCLLDSRSTAAGQRATSTLTAATLTSATALTSRFPQVRARKLAPKVYYVKQKQICIRFIMKNNKLDPRNYSVISIKKLRLMQT